MSQSCTQWVKKVTFLKIQFWAKVTTKRIWILNKTPSNQTFGIEFYRSRVTVVPWCISSIILSSYLKILPRFCADSHWDGEKTNWAIKRRDFDMTRSKSIFMSIIFGKELSNFFLSFSTPSRVPKCERSHRDLADMWKPRGKPPSFRN